MSRARNKCFVRVQPAEPDSTLLSYRFAVEPLERYSTYRLFYYDAYSTQQVTSVRSGDARILFSLPQQETKRRLVRWNVQEDWADTLVIYFVEVDSGEGQESPDEPSQSFRWLHDITLDLQDNIVVEFAAPLYK